MNAREAISQIACDLPDERVEKLLDYAPYLSHQEERAGWQEFGKLQLSKMYGDDEPEYTEADLKRKA